MSMFEFGCCFKVTVHLPVKAFLLIRQVVKPYEKLNIWGLRITAYEKLDIWRLAAETKLQKETRL